jgi:hypothetical protein
VLSANYIQPFPDFSHGEYFAKIVPINNIYWSAFSITRVKMLNINIKYKTILIQTYSNRPKQDLTIWRDCPFKGTVSPV